MATTLEKVQLLQNYIAIDTATVNEVVDRSIEKILGRERARLLELKMTLSGQIAAFEEAYGLSSRHFRERFSRGELGDEMDFVEWDATIDMLMTADKRLALLDDDRHG